MSFEVLYTEHFRRELKRLSKKHRSLKKDLTKLIETLEEYPTSGKSLGKDCYKIRLAITSKGKGKSSGARVITHFYLRGDLVYLLSIYDKSEKANVSDKEIEELLKLIDQ